MALKRYRATWVARSVYTWEFYANNEEDAREEASEGPPEHADWKMTEDGLTKLTEIPKEVGV